MRVLICLLFTLTLGAQEPAHSGFVRGVLVDPPVSADSGDFSLRVTGSNTVLRFTFDHRTYVERDKQRVALSALRSGEALEVVSDRVPGFSLRYARTVHVQNAEPAARPPAPSGMFRRYRSSIDRIAPRGNLTFSGVVTRVSEDRLTLRTRLDGEKMFLRRADTYYFADGVMVDAATLEPNVRVFVRAGRNFDDELEVYQVIWGDILEPGRLR